MKQNLINKTEGMIWLSCVLRGYWRRGSRCLRKNIGAVCWRARGVVCCRRKSQKDSKICGCLAVVCEKGLTPREDLKYWVEFAVGALIEAQCVVELISCAFNYFKFNLSFILVIWAYFANWSAKCCQLGWRRRPNHPFCLVCSGLGSLLRLQSLSPTW